MARNSTRAFHEFFHRSEIQILHITTRERPSRGFLDEEQQRLIPSRALYEFIAKSDREISRFARLASKFISARSELNLRVDMRYSDRCVVNYASCCWN